MQRILSWLFTVSLIIACAFANVACSTQVTQMADGRKLVNNNLMAQGVQVIGADGTVLQSGNAEVAARELAKYAGLLVNARLISSGITALKDVGNNALDTAAK